MKMPKSTTANMIAILLTIAVIVLNWKIVLPNYFSHKGNLTALEEEVNAAKTKLESLDQARADIAAVKSTADQIMVSVPKGKDEPNLISELEAIAIKNNIVIPSIDIAEESIQAGEPAVIAQTAAAPATVSEGAENVAEGTETLDQTAAAETAKGLPFTISFTVSGSFEELNGFIAGLEKSVRFMNIQSLTYEVLKEGEGNSLAVQIEVYQQ